jgi:hypothetical protein
VGHRRFEPVERTGHNRENGGWDVRRALEKWHYAVFQANFGEYYYLLLEISQGRTRRQRGQFEGC